MMKVRKKLFTLSGLFMVLAQVFVAAFCGITAIAITKDETRKTLFDTMHGVATMAYEETAENRLKWSISLEKKGSELPTKFNVELQSNDAVITPENLKATNETDSAIHLFEGDGKANSSIYEDGASDIGKVVVTFETANNLEKLTVKPHLMTTEANAVDLLKQEAETVFELPIVEESTDVLQDMVPETTSSIEKKTGTSESISTIVDSSSSREEKPEQAVSAEKQLAQVQALQNGINPTLFNSVDSMLNIGDERDIFLYNGVLSGNHSPMQADTEGALFISGDSVVPEGGSFNYAGKFNHGGGTGGVGTDLTERHRIAVAIGGEIRNYSGSKPVVGGTKIPAGADEKSVKHPGYFLTKQSSATGWMTKLGTYPHIMEIQGPSRYLPDAEFGNMENDLRGQQQRVYSMLDSKIAALNALDVKDREVYSKYTNWAGFNDNIIYRSPDDPSVLIYDLTKSSSGAVLLPGFRPEDSFIADDEVKQIIVYSDAEKVVAGHTDGVVDAKIAGKVIYYLPNATQVTNYAQKTGDYTATSVTAPDMPATFNNDAKNQFNETYFQDKEKKSAAYSGFLIAPKATAAMSGGNWNGYFWAHNLYQEGGWEIHNFYNPWVEEQVKFNFQLYKHDSTDKEKAIEDATFIFYRQKGDAIEYLQENNGTVEWTAIKEDAKEFVTDASGNISVTGIPEDTSYNYFFEEIDPALGYVLPENPVFQVGINETTKQPNVSIVSNTKESIEKLTSLRVEKKWDDNDNAYNTRKDIQLVLQRQLEGETTWSDVGTHNISSGATSESELSKTFENLPSIINGKNAIYRVIEKVLNEDGTYTEGRVPGYETPKYSPKSISNKLISKFGTLTVTNKLLTTELEFTKVGNDESTPLSGVSFTVTGEENGYKKTLTTGDDGKVLFEDLLELNPDLIPELDSDNPEKDGYYTLTETGLPGYLSAGPWKFSVVYNETSNSMEIVWKDGKSPLKDDKLVNTLKPFDLTVHKQDDLGNALKGAEFTLTGPEGFEKVLPNAENPGPISEFTFTGLSPGTYTLTETKVPDGYAKLSEAITITINEDGTVKVTGANATSALTVEGNNTISFDVKNKKKVPLPSTGGPGTLFFSLIGMLALGATGLYFYFRKDQEVA